MLCHDKGIDSTLWSKYFRLYGVPRPDELPNHCFILALKKKKLLAEVRSSPSGQEAAKKIGSTLPGFSRVKHACKCGETSTFSILKTVFFSERDGVTASEKKKMVGGIINSSSTHFQETRKK